MKRTSAGPCARWRPLAVLKALYARRWGIETSFRSLKYAVGLIHLHAKKPDLVLQEIFASFLIFNCKRQIPPHLAGEQRK